MNTCGLTLKTEGENAEKVTELPHPSVQTTDGRMGHPPRYITVQEIRAFATRQRACHPPGFLLPAPFTKQMISERTTRIAL